MVESSAENSVATKAVPKAGLMVVVSVVQWAVSRVVLKAERWAAQMELLLAAVMAASKAVQKVQ